jgi:hypothetical protein
MAWDLVFIGIGLGCCLVAIFEKAFWFGRSMGEGPFGRQAPNWFGKLAFSLAGVIFLLFGFLDLFGVFRRIT